MTRRDFEDEAPPPSYEEDPGSAAASESNATTSQPVAGSSTGTALPHQTWPDDAQRALAPLTLRTTNTAIKGQYLVDVGENKTAPDVITSSTNGSTNLVLYMRGGIPRPISIESGSTNGSVRLTIPVREAGQVYNIKAKTTNGSITIQLPLDFHGYLIIINRGSKEVDQRLRRNSVLVPSPELGSNAVKYKVTPHDESKGGFTPDRDESDERQDICEMTSVNGRLSVEYFDSIGNSQNSSASSGDKCVVC